MKQSQRSKRLGELIRRNLATIFISHYRDNPLIALITVTAVEVAGDLSCANVFFCILEEKNVKETLKELQHEGHNLRHFLARDLNLRLTPRLNFFYDHSSVKGQKLSLIIDQAVAEDEQRKQLLQQQDPEDI